MKSCCAAHPENAQKKAAQYGILACTYDEVLADPEVQLAIVLTPAPTHYELILRALLAGKHVYTEKVLSLDATQARRLSALADEKGLYLGCAPDTFLGAAWQKGRQVLEEGRKNKASKELALHVLEVAEAMMESSRRGAFVKL